MNNRIFGLDILRAFAIMTVVVGHGTHLQPLTLPVWVNKLIKYLFGYDGVSIFFVLSGFLIGGILIKVLEKKEFEKKDLLNFWIRRWLRTVPPYFLILTIILILNIIFTEGFKLSLKFPLNYFTFTQNLFYNHPYFFSEAWSLSIEEFFYLLIPPIIITFILLKQSVKKAILNTALSIIVLVTLFRIYRYFKITPAELSSFTTEDWDLIFRKRVITRLDSLMYGVLGAFLKYYYNSSWIKFKKIYFIIGLLLLLGSSYLIKFPVDSVYFCVFYFSINSFSTLLLLPFLSEFNYNKKGFFLQIITKISLISYSMYLINLTLVQGWMLENIPFEKWSVFTINQTEYIIYISYWLLTISLSIFLFKYFEIPMMNLRDNDTIKRWLKI